MFFDIGPLELVALVVLAVLVFGPDKLPKVIQDTMAFIRKVREFSDSAKEDIRRELGPEFKDFEFEDLNPKTFIRKNLMNDEDEYGLKELRELGNSLDLRKEMAEVTDAVNGVETVAPAARKGTATATGGTPGTGTPDRLRKREQLDDDEPPPFDADAT
ncbi:sec-independent translocase [Streptomyces sp. NBC_01198]|uniref:sec-independent translocase n=1 Tax=Streptomyces sp. NBC_01198 TaxID=2903769 RepID=UPI002E123C91|nr:sec-independent translocase [Streptomyces sp. NBC_01198]